MATSRSAQVARQSDQGPWPSLEPETKRRVETSGLIGRNDPSKPIADRQAFTIALGSAPHQFLQLLVKETSVQCAVHDAV